MCPGQRARDRGELPGAITEDEVRGVEHQAFLAAVETRILGGVMARGDGDAGERTVDHLGRRRGRRILRARVDLDAPLLGPAERIQDHRELRAAAPEQGAHRLVVRVDGGQPERQHRPVRRHARDDLVVRPPQPLDTGQVGHQAGPGPLTKRPLVHRADDGGEPRLGDGADLLPTDAGQAG